MVKNMMKALVLTGIGEPLRMQEVPVPELREGEALVRIKAAAFNRRDWWIQRGQYAGLKFPIILGSDGAGIVEKVWGGEGAASRGAAEGAGSGITAEAGAGARDAARVATATATDPTSWVGKEVLINPSLGWEEDSEAQPEGFSILGLPQDGTFGEFVRVPIKNLYEKPEYLTFEEAAALPLGGLTAYRAVFRKAGLQAGEKVLITGVGGGVATFALQWAVHAGAEVFVTSSSPKKIDKAIAAGVKAGVDYRVEGWAQKIKEISGGGVDVVIDSALGEGFAEYLELTNPGGRIVFFGGTTGNIPALNGRKIFWKQLQIKGTTMGSRVDFENMLAFVEKHQIRPLIDSVSPWEEAQSGLDNMTSSNQFGKIVLQM